MEKKVIEKNISSHSWLITCPNAQKPLIGNNLNLESFLTLNIHLAFYLHVWSIPVEYDGLLVTKLAPAAMFGLQRVRTTMLE